MEQIEAMPVPGIVEQIESFEADTAAIAAVAPSAAASTAAQARGGIAARQRGPSKRVRRAEAFCDTTRTD